MSESNQPMRKGLVAAKPHGSGWGARAAHLQHPPCAGSIKKCCSGATCCKIKKNRGPSRTVIFAGDGVKSAEAEF